MGMKNITLSVDERLLKVARRYAAERGTSVNAVVREFLTQLAEREDRARAARQRIRELADRSSAKIGDKSWDRDDLHDR